MERDTLEGMIIDYIDDKLNPEEKSRVEKELAENEKSYQLYEQLREVMKVIDSSKSLEPGSRLRDSFNRMLGEEMAKGGEAKVVTFRPMVYRIAAAIALVLSGVAVGFWINENNRRETELATLKAEMEMTKKLMLAMLDNPQSASSRMQGANVALRIVKADDEVVRALVKTMTEDDNTNVRLAALDALGKFQDEPLVRKALIGSLANQKDPVVQIALIQLLVKLKEKGVVDDLQKIIDDNQTIDAVKNEAYSGMLKLS